MHYRFNADAFNKYLPIFERFLAVYPEPYIFTPSNRSCETVSARLRDAATGFIEHNHPHPPSFDYDKFLLAWNNTVVSHDGERIRIGKRQRRGEKINTETPRNKAEIPVHGADQKIILAIATILDAGILTNTFRLIDYPSNLLPDLTQFPNLEIHPQHNDTILI